MSSCKVYVTSVLNKIKTFFLVVKFSNMKLHKDPSCGSYVTACSQEDRWTCMLKLIIAIQSVNVPSSFFLMFC